MSESRVFLSVQVGSHFSKQSPLEEVLFLDWIFSSSLGSKVNQYLPVEETTRELIYLLEQKKRWAELIRVIRIMSVLFCSSYIISFSPTYSSCLTLSSHALLVTLPLANSMLQCFQ